MATKRMLVFVAALAATTGLSSPAAVRKVVTLEPIARDGAGHVLALTHDEATRYCRDRKTRLPTAREVAGALNPARVSDSPRPKAIIIQPLREPGFYYEVRALQSLSPDEARYGLWTASTTNRLPGTGYSYVFDQSDGDLSPGRDELSDGRATRCVVKRQSSY